MWMLEAFLSKSWEPDFLTYFEYAESEKPGSQAEFWVLDHLICINKMAAKMSLLHHLKAIFSKKYVTRQA